MTTEDPPPPATTPYLDELEHLEYRHPVDGVLDTTYVDGFGWLPLALGVVQTLCLIVIAIALVSIAT